MDLLLQSLQERTSIQIGSYPQSVAGIYLKNTVKIDSRLLLSGMTNLGNSSLPVFLTTDSLVNCDEVCRGHSFNYSLFFAPGSVMF